MSVFLRSLIEKKLFEWASYYDEVKTNDEIENLANQWYLVLKSQSIEKVKKGMEDWHHNFTVYPEIRKFNVFCNKFKIEINDRSISQSVAESVSFKSFMKEQDSIYSLMLTGFLDKKVSLEDLNVSRTILANNEMKAKQGRRDWNRLDKNICKNS